jgi:hypothetical protein
MEKEWIMMWMFKNIPGFRSGIKWKMVVATIVYISILCYVINDAFNNVFSTEPTTTSVTTQPKTVEVSKPNTPTAAVPDSALITKTPEQIASEQKALDDAIDAQVAKDKADYDAKTKAYADADVQKLAALKSEAKIISYKDLARNPTDNLGMTVKYTGKVIQVQEDGGNVGLLVDVTKDDGGNYADTMVVSYGKSIIKGRVLEDDIISFWGTFTGLVTYKTVLGVDMTTPRVLAQIVELNN